MDQNLIENMRLIISDTLIVIREIVSLYSSSGSVEADFLVVLCGKCDRQVYHIMIPVDILGELRQLTVHCIHHEICLLDKRQDTQIYYYYYRKKKI